MDFNTKDLTKYNVQVVQRESWNLSETVSYWKQLWI